MQTPINPFKQALADKRPQIGLWLSLAGRHAGQAQAWSVRLAGLMLAAASAWALAHGLATAMGSDFCLPF